MPAEQFRRDRMAALADFSVGTGLEIGPLDRPIALKSECDVRYVDVFDAPTIRAHYVDDPGVDTAAVPDLDFCLHKPDGSIQSLVDAVSRDAPFQWVVASHVIEHVPDLIGWLGQISQVLVDGGTLVLAIPDRRYTFDALRPQTTVGQILQASVQPDTIPSVRAVYDHFRSLITASAPDLWAGMPASEDSRVYPLPLVLDQVRLAGEQGKYVDSHVWMFTPKDFVAQMAELGRMKLIDLYVERVIPTGFNEFEFYAALSRVPRGSSEEELAELIAASAVELVEPVRPEPEPEPETVVAADTPQPDPVEPGFPLSDREITLIRTKRRVINLLLRRK